MPEIAQSLFCICSPCTHGKIFTLNICSYTCSKSHMKFMLYIIHIVLSQYNKKTYKQIRSYTHNPTVRQYDKQCINNIDIKASIKLAYKLVAVVYSLNHLISATPNNLINLKKNLKLVEQKR